MELQIVARSALRKILNYTICNSSLLGVAFFINNMIPRNKKVEIIVNSHLNKEQFLVEHNKLAPANLGATISLLSRFKIEKTLLFKDNSWSIEKLRRPFIFWLTSLTSEEKAKINKQGLG